MILPTHIKLKVNLSAETEQELITVFQRKELPKGHFLFREGEQCRHIFFIEKGLARIYYTTERGKEITTGFAANEAFSTAIDSFYENIPSQNNCELLEDSIVYSISYSQMEELMNKNQYMTKFAFHAVFEIAKRMSSFITSIKFQTAQERYHNLLAESPYIFQKVQLSYIASYLGITPETLSRLRAEK